MTSLISIGNKILQTRKAVGLTQVELAALAKINRSYLSCVENGRVNLSVTVLVNIAKALKISPSKLIDV
jgi:transcriptional regulator with XRE-family HTH domain